MKVQEKILSGEWVAKQLCAFGRYWINISPGKIILWCYLLWYLAIMLFYFEPDVELWINALGISLVVGTALLLSVGPLTKERFTLKFWESFRLYLCPFLVSSFSALVKNKGFFLLFSPMPGENIAGCILILGFLSVIVVSKKVVPQKRMCGL